MYDEKEDFLHHKSEIDAMVSVLDTVGVRLSRQMTVLDLGAGQGMHAGFLSALAGRVFCADLVDYSSLYNGEFLRLIDEKHQRNNVEFHRSRVAFHQTDAMDLIYRDSMFDCVVSVNSFEHIPDPGKALAEMIRVTKSGGYIYISTDPIWTADTGSHFFHRVAEPWAHLFDDENVFAAKMLANGAPDNEVREFRGAMNRWRAKDYARVIDRSVADRQTKAIHRDSWSGVVDEAHRTHGNLQRLLTRGFTEEELLIRGLRWVLRKC